MAEEKLNDRVAQDVKQYVQLRVDEAKLTVVEGLSSIIGSAIGLVICLFLVNLALMLFSGAFLYLINMLVNSWVWSMVILGSIYLVVGIWIFMKPGFFKNKMVSLFAPMFFCQKEEEDDDE